MDAVALVPGTVQLQKELCAEQVAWCTASKRTFLRHRVELRLAALHLETHDYTAALALITSCAAAAAPRVL